MEFVRASKLLSCLEEQHPHVEAWRDEKMVDGSSEYFWIVSQFEPGSVRNLAYIRVVDDQRIQIRKYDSDGEDLWIDTE